jgi:hypothetical protein
MTGKRNHPSSPSILLIGATSLAGHEIVNQLVDHSSQPTVHIFCDRSTDLHDKHQKSCASICYGDSSRATDILEALRETEANIIILCIDSRDDAKSKILTDSAWAVCSAMKMPGFYHINAIVLSSFGAGTSRIKIRRLLGYGRLLSRRRRNSLKDCTGQESAFLVNGLDNRTVIIRTTDLTDGKPTGNIVEFGDEERVPSYRVDCVDVANYVAREIFNGMTGRIVNITGR